MSRLVSALLLFFGFGACTPPARPPAAPLAVAGVEHREARLRAHGDIDLYVQSWRPAGSARGAVLLAHGLKDHSARYAELAQHLAAQGLAVHAFDLRGHGRSAGERARAALGEYVADLTVVATQVRAAEPGLPLFVFGHSMGGAIATTYALEHPGELQGLVLSAAALRLGPDAGPGLVKLTRKLGRNHPAGASSSSSRSGSRATPPWSPTSPAPTRWSTPARSPPAPPPR
ncbi:alpha/beta fold hydrolase [Nannocystis pusilla]|uniref:Alpha/beta fold hydrolase n=1 Tax=Nannocystis pusilla TaxID=889268 RepID=A0A9X3F0X6_9BACT|nr:alpha/beta fold hydrolase [Nannocystis pusilla]MCY1009336.1 alpha/beta fold hydrolase [Nannocystis pusilla]